MQQLLNHISQDSAYEISNFPVGFDQLGRARYWVQYSDHLKKDRAFLQVDMGHGNGWAQPKVRETHDIILLALEDDANGQYATRITFLGWDGYGKSGEEIAEFAQSHVFTQLQRTKIQGYLKQAGYHQPVMWLSAPVPLEEHVPAPRANAKSVGSGKVPGLSRKNRIWKLVGHKELPADQMAREKAHMIKAGSYDIVGARFEVHWARLQDQYDNLFDFAYLVNETGVGQDYIANLKRAIAFVDGVAED